MLLSYQTFIEIASGAATDYVILFISDSDEIRDDYSDILLLGRRLPVGWRACGAERCRPEFIIMRHDVFL